MHKRSLASAIALATVMAAAPAFARDGDTTRQSMVQIEEQPLESALNTLAQQLGIQIAVFSDDVDSFTVTPLSGRYESDEAVRRLIDGSGLQAHRVNEQMIVVGSPGRLKAKYDQTKEEEAEGNDESAQEEKEVDEEIIVTGSRIARTPSQLAANVIVLNDKDLLASGETTLAGALRQLPQNIFGARPLGAAIEDSGMSFNGAINIAGASSINLRGLGGESTLVLIDGNRIGKSGVFGGVSDISGIPLRSVERVEIMLDGASSIYGSDAVGGVVNIITKKDFEGGEATYEYGSSELGGFSEHVLTVSGSKAWDSGRIYGTVERYQRNNLDAAERPEQVSTEPLAFFANPGVVTPNGFFSRFFRFNGEVTTIAELLPFYSFGEIFAMVGSGELEQLNAYLPPNQDGAGLSRNDLVFGDGGATARDDRAGMSILPKQTLNSLQAGFDQQLQLFGRALTLSGNAYYSKRETYAADGEFTFQGSISADDPNNPLPGQGITVGWSMPGFADKHYQTDQEVVRWNLSLAGDIGDSWSWDMSAGQSRTRLDALYFNEAILPSSPEYQALIDNGLNILASDLVAANAPDLLQGLISSPLDTLSVNTENMFEITANGALWTLPAGDIYMAFGGAWRQEGLESGSRRSIYQGSSGIDSRSIGSTVSASLPTDAFDNVEVSRTQRSLFTELLVPLIGADNALTGIQQLNVTGSARYDSYHEQGSDSTWSLGMIWRPADQITVKANRSTSYVVPTFRDQLIPTRTTDHTENPAYAPLGLPRFLFDENNVPTGEFDYIGLVITGGNPELEPETASTLSVGIEIVPDALPGFTFNASWHQTEYNNRIGAPPNVEVFVPGVGSGYYDNDYDTRFGRTLFRGDNGLLVWDRRTVNTALVETSGVDYRMRYNRETGYGHFIVTANIGYTSKYNTIDNPGDEPLNQVDTVEFGSLSVIPRWRYNTQLQWYHRGVGVSLNASTASKTESVSTFLTPLAGAGGSITTRSIEKPPLRMDLVLTYDFDEGDLFAVPGWLQGSAISIKIPRLLNETTESQRIVNGEPVVAVGLNANTADPIGRMLHVSLTKRF